MAKIDEIVARAIKELKEKEIELLELDDKIKDIFKTKKSVFENMRDLVINTSNGIVIIYNFEVKSLYQIYITFKVIERKNDQKVKYMKVKLIDIIRM